LKEQDVASGSSRTNTPGDHLPDRRSILLGGTALAAASALSMAATTQVARAQQPAQPNILFMLADNVGYGVPSCYNGGILDTPTPRIDQLAAEGLKLTNFNVENQCTPSRAALMTGRLPIRSGIGKAIAAGAPGGLHPWEITIAEMLGEAGYRTAMFGKWHLGAGQGRLPTDQGFDEWFGFETTDIIYWAGKPGMPLRDVDYIREARKGEKPRNLHVYDEDMRRQIDRMVTDRAVGFLGKNAKGDRPFFLYVPFAFAHHLALAHPDFKGKSPGGEFGDSLLEHTITTSDASSTRLPWPASPTTPSWSGRATTARRRCRRLRPLGPSAMPVHGAARSARCWKEISVHPVLSAGRVKFPAAASATRSSLSSISFRRLPASPAARSQPTVRSMASISSIFSSGGRRNRTASTRCCFWGRS
jgi:hypothetical protein